MNEDNENERQDQKENDSLLRSLREDTKRKAKSKFNMVFRKAMAIVVPILLKLLLPLILVSVIIAGAWSIIKDYSENNVSAEASSKAIKSEEIVDIVPSDDGNGYYFKISKDVVKTYLKELNKAYNNGYYKMYVDKDNLEEQNEDDEDDDKFDESDMEKWFGTEDYEAYFVKMLRAEIASTYPRLSDDNVAVDRYDEQNNPIDKDGNYIAQGVVQIKRTKMNLDGSVGDELFLDYLPHEDFSALVDAQNLAALNYYSFDSDTGLIYYATYQETVVQTGDGEPVITFSLSEKSESYKALTAMCSMPYNFTFSLLQKTGNPEWVMAVIDLLLEEQNNEVILMIQDQLSVTTHIEEKGQVGATTTATVTYAVQLDKDNNPVAVPTGSSSSTSYEFPVNKITEIIKTLTNTANIYIQKANTWCMNFEQEAVPNPNNGVDIEGEKTEYKLSINTNETMEESNVILYGEDDLSNLKWSEPSIVSDVITGNPNGVVKTVVTFSITIPDEATGSDGTLKVSKQDIYTNYSFNINNVVGKEINYERFLGTLKNDTGRYYVGSQYKEDGIEIKYKEPGGRKEILNATTQVSDGNGQTINRILNYLSLHDNTEMHEQLMSYFWNIYTNSDTYDVNVDNLLNYFNTNSFISVSGYYGSTAEEKLWWALLDKGYSKIAAAAVLGNIYQESQFNSSLLESTDKLTEYTSETYTEAVDNGTYTREMFINDGVGYGLAQWTNSSRKARLYDYAKSKGVSISNISVQIEFLLAEISGDQSIAGKELLDRKHDGIWYYADDWQYAEATEDKTEVEAVEKATEAFCWCFENPGNAMMQTRITQAVHFYEEFKDKEKPSFEAEELVEAAGYIFPHYLQDNYAHVMYGIPSKTISSSGCGPTSMAMILAGLKNDPSITPETFVKELEEYYPSYTSYYLPGTGSYGSALCNNGFLGEKYGCSSEYIGNNPELGLNALEQGYPILGAEEGHFLAIIPVPDEYKVEGYRLYILDSDRGHDGQYKTISDANQVVRGNLELNYIIKPY